MYIFLLSNDTETFPIDIIYYSVFLSYVPAHEMASLIIISKNVIVFQACVERIDGILYCFFSEHYTRRITDYLAISIQYYYLIGRDYIISI